MTENINKPTESAKVDLPGVFVSRVLLDDPKRRIDLFIHPDGDGLCLEFQTLGQPAERISLSLEAWSAAVALSMVVLGWDGAQLEVVRQGLLAKRLDQEPENLKWPATREPHGGDDGADSPATD